MLDELFGTVEGGQGGVNPGGFIVGKDGVRRYVKSSLEGNPGATYAEALITKIYESLGLNVPKVDLLNIGKTLRMYDPGNQKFYIDPSYFKPGELVLSSKVIENIKNPLKFYDQDEIDPWMPENINNSINDAMRIALSQEKGIGRAVDLWLGLSDTHTNNYAIKYRPSSPLTEKSILNPVRLDLGSNAFTNAVGNLRQFDITRPLAGTYQESGFARLSSLEMINQINKLWNILQKDFGGLEGLLNPIKNRFSQTAPNYVPQDPNFIKLVLHERLKALLDDPRSFGYSDGGPVDINGFAEGGLADLDKMPKFAGGGIVELKKLIDKWVGNQASYYSGWDSYSNWSSGLPVGMVMHHSSGVGPGVLEWMARTGRVEYGSSPGPIVQSFIEKNGKTHILSGGALDWGTGTGEWETIQENYGDLIDLIEPYGNPNRSMWQIEVESEGITPDFTTSQFDSVAKLTSAIREYGGWPTFNQRIINHKDWAVGRKSDTLYPTSTFVNNAQKIWESGGGSTPTTTTGSSGYGYTNTAGTSSSYVTISFGAPNAAPGDRYLRSKLGLLGQRTETITVTSGGGAPTTSEGSSTGTTGTPGAGGITLNPADYQDNIIKGYKLVKLIYGTGWTSKDEVRTGYGVVMGESGGNRTAVNVNEGGSAPGSRDLGLWQINDFYHKTVNGDPVDFGERINDAIYNSSIAFKIAKDPSSMQIWGSQWGSWNAFTNNTSEYNRGMKEFDTNPEWWQQLVQETGGQFARGGFVQGPGTSTSDSIPALLSDGEYVIKASSVDKYGTGMLDKLNAGHYAKNGIVKGFNEGGIANLDEMWDYWIKNYELIPASERPWINLGGHKIAIDSLMTGMRWSNAIKSTGPGPDDYTVDMEVLAKNRSTYLEQWYNALNGKSNVKEGDLGNLAKNAARKGDLEWGGTWPEFQAGGIADVDKWWDYWVKNYELVDPPWIKIGGFKYYPGSLGIGRFLMGAIKSTGGGPDDFEIDMNKVAENRKEYLAQWHGMLTGKTKGPRVDWDNLTNNNSNGETLDWGGGWPNFAKGGIIKKYMAGGSVFGPGTPTSDSIPAMLSNGEYVIRASSVKKYGKTFMDKINSGTFGMGGMAVSSPRMSVPTSNYFASGGFVGNSIPEPSFSMPSSDMGGVGDIASSVSNSYGPSSSSNSTNSSNVKIVINAARGQNVNSIARSVVNLINKSNNRRNHSRSI